MKTIAVIPARGGSKRLPGKNIRTLGDHPLIAHSILFAQKNHRYIDQVFVSTDDEAIANLARDYDAEVIERPSALSGDHEPTVSAVKHVLQSLSDKVEKVVLLQPTNPLRPADLLQNAMDLLDQNPTDSLFTVSRSYHKLGRIADNQFVPYNYQIGQRSQDLEPLYYENGLLYVSRRDVIMANDIISHNALPMVVDHVFGDVDIDTESDWSYAEYLLNSYL